MADKLRIELGRTVTVTIALVLFACTSSGGPVGESQVTSTASYSPVDVYETMIRYLAKSRPMPIYVESSLCFQIPPAEGCPDHLTRDEETQLSTRLTDVGKIDFRPKISVPVPSKANAQIQLILLSPIVEKPDGLRVEGATVCGGLCGSGSVYVVVPSGAGWEVRAKDESYGSWVS